MSAPTNVELLRSENAWKVLENEQDPVTKALLNNANYWLLRKFFTEETRPVANFDYQFYLELLRDIFSEHEVLERLLKGERVGAFFDDEDQRQPGDSLPTEVVQGRELKRA
jgi:hypothetical protein